MLDNQSFLAEIAMADESIIYDVCDNSTAEELVMSDTFIDGQVLHNQKREFGDNKSVSPSGERDLELKFQKDGKNDCPFDSVENVMAVQLKSSYSKKDNEREQCSDFDVKKAISTNRNQLTMGVSGQEEIIQYRRRCCVVLLQTC